MNGKSADFNALDIGEPNFATKYPNVTRIEAYNMTLKASVVNMIKEIGCNHIHSHDALDDAKIESEILRTVWQNFYHRHVQITFIEQQMD